MVGMLSYIRSIVQHILSQIAFLAQSFILNTPCALLIPHLPALCSHSLLLFPFQSGVSTCFSYTLAGMGSEIQNCLSMWC